MCMQDLAIASRVNVRRCEGLTAQDTNVTAVAPNPNRVWLAVGTGGGGQPPGVFLDSAALTSQLNGMYDSAGGGVFNKFVLLSSDAPGVFSVTLYLNTALAGAVVYEGVQEPNLSMAVQRLGEEIDTAGRY